MMQWTITICILAFILISKGDQPDQEESQVEVSEDETGELFPATYEWQVAKKGQRFPKSIHVRINMETGFREAKLLDPEESRQPEKDGTHSLSVLPEEDKPQATVANVSTDVNKTITSEPKRLTVELEEALKKIKNEDPSLPDDGTKKLRTLEELMNEFGGGLEMGAKTDVEVMQDLFRRYETIKKYFPNAMKDKFDQNTIDSPASVEILNILEDFEYLVHQYDNAISFMKMNGFEEIIYPHLNGTDDVLKAEAIKVLGSCLQNNIQVQVYALETNAGEHLLKILALDKNDHVKSKALYALGCLVRRFPLAQKQIISKQGMDLFHKILISENPSNVKLKLKIIMLLEDLVLEHKSVLENHNPGNPAEEDKLRQYYQVDLMSKLSNSLSCDILSRLLQEYFEHDKMDVDSIDKIFSVINTFSHICKHHHYKDKKLLLTFHKIQTHYSKIVKEKINNADTEDDAEFFSQILQTIDEYINSLNDAKVKDEL